MYLVEISPDDMDVAGQCFQVVVGFFGAQIPGAENVLDFSRDEEFLKLGVHRVASMRDMKIARNEDQHFENGFDESLNLWIS